MKYPYPFDKYDFTIGDCQFCDEKDQKCAALSDPMALPINARSDIMICWMCVQRLTTAFIDTAKLIYRSEMV